MNNDIIRGLAKEYTEEYRNSSQQSLKENYERFKYTQAKVARYYKIYANPLENGTVEYVLLTPIISYQTCVAIADETHCIFYEVDKYSTTTFKHCTQIYNTFYKDYKRVLIKGGN